MPEGSELFPIVGVGASAGGIEALEGFFGGLPERPGFAVVIVTHLNPARESLLHEIVARHTRMPVHIATDGADVAVNTVYVLPEDAALSIKDRQLAVIRPEPGRRARKPIDVFFSALALDLRGVCRRGRAVRRRRGWHARHQGHQGAWRASPWPRSRTATAPAIPICPTARSRRASSISPCRPTTWAPGCCSSPVRLAEPGSRLSQPDEGDTFDAAGPRSTPSCATRSGMISTATSQDLPAPGAAAHAGACRSDGWTPMSTLLRRSRPRRSRCSATC